MQLLLRFFSWNACSQSWSSGQELPELPFGKHSSIVTDFGDEEPKCIRFLCSLRWGLPCLCHDFQCFTWWMSTKAIKASTRYQPLTSCLCRKAWLVKCQVSSPRRWFGVPTAREQGFQRVKRSVSNSHPSFLYRFITVYLVILTEFAFFIDKRKLGEHDTIRNTQYTIYLWTI